MGGGEGRCGRCRPRAISGHNTRSENGRFASIREEPPVLDDWRERPDGPATRSRSTRTRNWCRWRSQPGVQLSELHDSVRNELVLWIAPIQPRGP
jgi:hypothetical protein